MAKRKIGGAPQDFVETFDARCGDPRKIRRRCTTNTKETKYNVKKKAAEGENETKTEDEDEDEIAARKKRRKAKAIMRIVLLVFLGFTCFSLLRMMFNMVWGSAVESRPSYEAPVNAEEDWQPSKAELQRPYYAYVNEQLSNATTAFGKIHGVLNNLACFTLLWKTSSWGWGVHATVHFTIALFWEIVAILIALPLFLKFRKIAYAKPEPKKRVVDPQKFIRKAEAAKAEAEAEAEAEAVKSVEELMQCDPNELTLEEWNRVQEYLTRQRRVQRWRKGI